MDFCSDQNQFPGFVFGRHGGILGGSKAELEFSTLGCSKLSSAVTKNSSYSGRLKQKILFISLTYTRSKPEIRNAGREGLAGGEKTNGATCLVCGGMVGAERS